MPLCPLCRKSVSEFKANSHVIPEWMYKGTDIYDEKRRIMKWDLKTNTESLLQKGYRGNFICANCEQETAELDRYASRVFRGGNHPKGFIKQEQPSNTRFKKRHFWQGFDFKKIQNFVYSICLRQHFYDVSQGRREIINKEHLCPILNLYRSESTDDKSYPVFIVYLSRDSEFYKIIISPHISKKQDHHVIQFAACGFQFIVKMSFHAGLFSDEIRLKHPGSIYMWEMNPEESEMIKKAIDNLKRFP